MYTTYISLAVETLRTASLSTPLFVKMHLRSRHVSECLIRHSRFHSAVHRNVFFEPPSEIRGDSRDMIKFRVRIPDADTAFKHIENYVDNRAGQLRRVQR